MSPLLYYLLGLAAVETPGSCQAANALIAAGTILTSLAGTLARLTGNDSSFWKLLTVGCVVLFCGFLLTAARASRTSAGSSIA